VQYSPGILGLFLGKTGVVDPAKNKAVINMIAAAALRAETDLVALEFSGVVRDMGGANISLVKDVTTGKTDGGILDVTGSKIRSVNADGTGLGLLTLVNTTDQSVAATITVLAINDPKRLMFNIPADLAKGSYQLTLETWFSTNSTQLKQSRTLTYAIPLVVGGTSGGGEDDRPVID